MQFEGNREDLIKSFETLKAVDFDVLVPGLYTGDKPFEEVTKEQKNTYLQQMIDRLRGVKSTL
jgi:hypothetical protein